MEKRKQKNEIRTNYQDKQTKESDTEKEKKSNQRIIDNMKIQERCVNIEDGMKRKQ